MLAELFVGWLDGLAAELAGAAVRSLVVALTAGGALWLSRPKRAAVSHLVWTLVLLGMLLLPFGSFLPAIRSPFPIEVFVSRDVAATVPNNSPAPGIEAGRGPLPSAATTSLASERPAIEWRQLVAFLYLGVTGFLLIRLGLAYVLARRLVSSSALVWESRPNEEVAHLARKIGVRPLPWLAESEVVSVPVVFGLAKPTVLLPAGWQSWNGAKLRAVLAHELTHIQRGDNTTAMLAALNRCLYWFHPLAWWLERHLAKLAEQAGDDAAIRITGDRLGYADLLLEMAEEVQRGNGRLLATGMAMARPVGLSQRITRLLDSRYEPATELSRPAKGAALALCLPLLYVTAAMQSAASQTPGTKPQATVAADSPFSDFGLLNQGWLLTEEEAARLEEQLQSDPEDLHARALLISYYFQRAEREPRLRHVFWMIEHHRSRNCSIFGACGSMSLTR